MSLKMICFVHTHVRVDHDADSLSRSTAGTIDMHANDLGRAAVSYDLALRLLKQHGEKRGEAQVSSLSLSLSISISISLSLSLSPSLSFSLRFSFACGVRDE